MAFFTSTMVMRNRSLLSSSNLAWVGGSEKSVPSKRDSISTQTGCWLLRALLAPSASFLSFPRAWLSLLISLLYFLINIDEVIHDYVEKVLTSHHLKRFVEEHMHGTVLGKPAACINAVHGRKQA